MTENEVYIDHRRPSLCTRSGMEFSPLEPDASKVSIHDIGWALGMKCRYTGHTSTFYSVAEHSLLVMLYCEYRWPDRPELARSALLHDAGEAYLPDVTGPVKRDPRVSEWFLPIEAGVEAAIGEALDIEFPMPQEVAFADKEVLKVEVPLLMPRSAWTSWWKIKAPDETAQKLPLLGLAPPVATLRFMQSYRRLFM